MSGIPTRRHLLKLAAWALPSFAIAQTAQSPTAVSNKGKPKPSGEPFAMTSYCMGNDFRQLSEPEKSSYLLGMWDGFMFAPVFGGKAKNDQVLRDCIPGLESDQLLAIVNKYMDEHPEKWGDPMGSIVFSALPPDCRAGIVR